MATLLGVCLQKLGEATLCEDITKVDIEIKMLLMSHWNFVNIFGAATVPLYGSEPVVFFLNLASSTLVKFYQISASAIDGSSKRMSTSDLILASAKERKELYSISMKPSNFYKPVNNITKHIAHKSSLITFDNIINIHADSYYN